MVGSIHVHDRDVHTAHVHCNFRARSTTALGESTMNERGEIKETNRTHERGENNMLRARRYIGAHAQKLCNNGVMIFDRYKTYVLWPVTCHGLEKLHVCHAVVMYSRSRGCYL